MADILPDILDLPESVHTLLLAFIPPKTRLLTLPLVCKLFLGLVEEDCQLLCAQHGWRAARRPRGVCAAESSSPFRRLYLNHSCACCYAVGDFCVRARTPAHVPGLAHEARNSLAPTSALVGVRRRRG